MTELHRIQVGIRNSDSVKIVFRHKYGEIDYIGMVGPAPKEYVSRLNDSMIPVVLISTCFAAMLDVPNPIFDLEQLGPNPDPKDVLRVIMSKSTTAMIRPMVDVWASSGDIDGSRE
jgi:hypothetical protein